MARPNLDPTEFIGAIGQLAETLQHNPTGAAAIVTLSFFALMAWVVYKLAPRKR
ncbi:hypothetical protein [Burkholderia pseudomallei]|uniref:hypothetical protein n=1 Tax=Burkholderia pseudomallei TaxID=28450 RepID=UPI0015C368E0|nr:hypothetical protein [Burkholderia pseudomallei]